LSTVRWSIVLAWAESSTSILNGRQTRQGAAPSPDTGPSIFTAIQEQLGLKLEPATAPLDIIVIDSAERPAQN
jgi:uncharacterized protein (TIGR03435 family)